MLTPLYSQYKIINNLTQEHSLITKKLHRDKTLVNLLHMGALLIPKWMQGIQKEININLHSPYFANCSLLDLTTYFTYFFAIPVISLDLYQRKKRITLLNKLLSQQKNLLTELSPTIDHPPLQPKAHKHLSLIQQQEQLTYKKIKYDLARHKAQNVTNIGKLISGLSCFTMEILKTIGAISSLKIAALGSIIISGPFLFCTFVLITSLIDLFFAIQKFILSLQQQKVAQQTLNSLQETPSLNIFTNPKDYDNHLEHCQKNLDKINLRVKKRQAKLIMRMTVVMTATAIILPTFGVPFLFAALAGTLTFSVYGAYYLYQRHNHNQKTTRPVLKSSCAPN